MRASEYGIKRISATQVEFTVDTETFGEDLQAAGIAIPRFIAHFDVEAYAVTHATSKRYYTEYFDLTELTNDILFAALNEPQTFFGGDAK